MSSEEEPSERKPLRQVIPHATFIQDVKGFVGARSVDDVIRELQEFMQKYKYVEQQIQKKKAKLLMKEPDIKRCLDAINLLVSKRDGKGDESDDAASTTTIDFALSDNIYARAKLSSSINSVNLWLGAGVMLEYPLDEAQSLLETQLSNCKNQLESCELDYQFIRDQITTTEVSIARVYNYDIEKRRSGGD